MRTTTTTINNTTTQPCKSGCGIGSAGISVAATNLQATMPCPFPHPFPRAMVVTDPMDRFDSKHPLHYKGPVLQFGTVRLQASQPNTKLHELLVQSLKIYREANVLQELND